MDEFFNTLEMRTSCPLFFLTKYLDRCGEPPYHHFVLFMKCLMQNPVTQLQIIELTNNEIY